MDDAYGSDWKRPSRLVKKNKSSNPAGNRDLKKVEKNKKAAALLRHRTSPALLPTQAKRSRQQNDSGISFEFESPLKKARTCFQISPAARRCSSASPSSEPKSLVQRMTTQEDSPRPSPTCVENGDNLLLLSYLPSIREEITPKRLRFGQRKILLPAPAPISPSEYIPLRKGPLRAGKRQTQPSKLFESLGKEVTLKDKLCLDWSLKTHIKIESTKPFGWSSTHLKASEESSGTSAFVRCIDITSGSLSGRPEENVKISQLDTSLGAQFHSACLYWQHPHIPSISLYPRMERLERETSNQSLTFSGNRLDEKLLKCVQSEWNQAFRSCFHLLRSRQCPYFYVCAPQFTALFAAAGTQGDERPQIFVNPSSRVLREALKEEGVNFTMPYRTDSAESDELMTKCKLEKNSQKEETIVSPKGDESDDDETSKWMDDMGISQDVTLTSFRSNSFGLEEKENSKKSLLLVAGGSDSLSFFNFLLNSKSFLVSSGGSTAGIPPTILSPIAFHGATMRTLKVKQFSKPESGKPKYTIELIGPILPNAIHHLSSLLSSKMENYTIFMSTLRHTIPLNLYTDVNIPIEVQRPAAFELENLSDSGLPPKMLQILCKLGYCDTINTKLEYKDSMYQWF